MLLHGCPRANGCYDLTRNISQNLAFASEQEEPMPRFHFEIVDGFSVEDPHDTELPTEHHAQQLAREMARQIATDVQDHSHTEVVVKTDRGEEIYKTPIKPD